MRDFEYQNVYSAIFLGKLTSSRLKPSCHYGRWRKIRQMTLLRTKIGLCVLGVTRRKFNIYIPFTAKPPLWGPISTVLRNVRSKTPLNPRLQDTTCCQTGCPGLSNRDNRIDNRLYVCIHDTTGCQTGCQNRLSNRFDNRLYHVYKHSTGCQRGLTTGCIV